MKTNKTRIIYIVSTVALCVLSVLCGILIFSSDLTGQSQYSFTVLLLGGTIALVWFLTYGRDTYLCEKYQEENALHLKRTADLTEQVRSLNCTIEALNADKTTASQQIQDYETLRQKCEALENFRSSFPCEINEEYTLFAMLRTDLQIGKHSCWQFVGEYQGRLWECRIIRPDTQTYKDLLLLAINTHTPQEIGALNRSNAMLWE